MPISYCLDTERENMENCENCRWRKDLVKFDYSKGGCIHTRQSGYACLGLADEGEVAWLIGVSEFREHCEMFVPKES